MPPLAKCLGPGPLGRLARRSVGPDARVRRCQRARRPQTLPSSYIAPVEATSQPPPPRREAPTSGAARPRQRPTGREPGPSTGCPSLGPMASGLAIVLGLFLAVAWVLRRAAPKGRHLAAQRGGRGPRPRTAGGPSADAPAPLRQQAAAGLGHSHRRRDPDRSDRSASRWIGWPGCAARPIRRAPRPPFAKCSNNSGRDRRAAMLDAAGT